MAKSEKFRAKLLGGRADHNIKFAELAAFLRELGCRERTEGGPSVILTVQKQPHANTLTLTRDIDRVLDEFEAELPSGMRLEASAFVGR